MSDLGAPPPCLPRLEPVLVADDDADVERLVRAARAGLARLALDVRVARHDADATAAGLPAAANELGSDRAAVDAVGAAAVRWKELRRAELAEAHAAAQREADAVVAAARREADAIRVAAAASVLGTIAPGPSPARSVLEEARHALREPRAVMAPGADAGPPTQPTPRVVPFVPMDVPAAVTPVQPRRRPALGQLLYVDVLLPLIGAVVVLVVLLAWVG